MLARQPRTTIHPPDNNTMKFLPYFFLLLSATPLVGAQTVSRDPDALANRPLNLSARQPGAPVLDATVILLPPAPDAPAPLPYGAGFESRQKGSTAGSGNSGSGGSSGGAGSGSGSGGSSGNGGGGRGGSGRGR